VLQCHRVSVLCDVGQNGCRRWALVKDTLSTDGDRRAEGAYLVLKIHKAIGAVGVVDTAMAPLRIGTVDVVAERLLPWLVWARTLSGAEMHSVVGGVHGYIHGLREEPVGSPRVWGAASLHLMSAFSIRCFARGMLCHCKVDVACNRCSNVSIEQRCFRADNMLKVNDGLRKWAHCSHLGNATMSVLASSCTERNEY
jgi:hypothetical protein